MEKIITITTCCTFTRSCRPRTGSSELYLGQNHLGKPRGWWPKRHRPVDIGSDASVVRCWGCWYLRMATRTGANETSSQAEFFLPPPRRKGTEINNNQVDRSLVTKSGQLRVLLTGRKSGAFCLIPQAVRVQSRPVLRRARRSLTKATQVFREILQYAI